jgi:hypothetical protein
MSFLASSAAVWLPKRFGLGLVRFGLLALAFVRLLRLHTFIVIAVLVDIIRRGLRAFLYSGRFMALFAACCTAHYTALFFVVE